MSTTTNEANQPVRLTLWLGGRMQRVEFTGTVWGVVARPGAPEHRVAPRRVGRAKYGAKEYAVAWSDADGVWSHVETPPQYDPNEGGE